MQPLKLEVFDLTWLTFCSLGLILREEGFVVFGTTSQYIFLNLKGNVGKK